MNQAQWIVYDIRFGNSPPLPLLEIPHLTLHSVGEGRRRTSQRIHRKAHFLRWRKGVSFTGIDDQVHRQPTRPGSGRIRLNQSIKQIHRSTFAFGVVPPGCYVSSPATFCEGITQSAECAEGVSVPGAATCPKILK